MVLFDSLVPLTHHNIMELHQFSTTNITISFETENKKRYMYLFSETLKAYRFNEKYNFIAVYVNDILSIKEAIRIKFKLVDNGNLKHFLYMEIKREDDTGLISVIATTLKECYYVTE